MLAIYFSDTTPDKVHAAADDLIREYDQSPVMIHANQTATEFYLEPGHERVGKPSINNTSK